MAARSYFGKSARDLTLGEGALAGRDHQGAELLQSGRNADRARERSRYVLGRMQDDGAITAAENKSRRAAFPDIVPDDQVERAPGSFLRTMSAASSQPRAASARFALVPIVSAPLCSPTCSRQRSSRCRRAWQTTRGMQVGWSSRDRSSISRPQSSDSRRSPIHPRTPTGCKR